MAKTVTAKELAAEYGTDPRTVRKFLRKQGLGVGQGARYSLDARTVRALRSKFSKWDAARNETKSDETPSDAPEGDENPEEITEGDETADDEV